MSEYLNIFVIWLFVRSPSATVSIFIRYPLSLPCIFNTLECWFNSRNFIYVSVQISSEISKCHLPSSLLFASIHPYKYRVIHSFIHLLTHSSIHSFIHSFIHWHYNPHAHARIRVGRQKKPSQTSISMVSYNHNHNHNQREHVKE